MNVQKDLFMQRFTAFLAVEEGEEKSVKRVYNALAKAVIATLRGEWEQPDRKKRACYLSAEFLIGKLVFSNLLNLGVLQDVSAALADRGVDITALEEADDPALGNGGLGRLAACFLDSAATHALPVDGYGLYYRYGLFKQKIEDGFQAEYADDWRKWGEGCFLRREMDEVKVDFADFSVRAVPYDTPVIGFENGCVNNLRLWSAESYDGFDFKLFDDMQGEQNALNDYRAERITDVLYPNDGTKEGRKLRLMQEYFLSAATVFDLLRALKRRGRGALDLGKECAVQLNDTHPVLAILEYIRLAMDEGAEFEQAFQAAQTAFCYTNHTVLAEALERWDEELFAAVVPRLHKIVTLINERAVAELGKGFAVVKDGQIHMADIAVYSCKKINGVAKIHTDILRRHVFKAWHGAYPERFENVTNGITQRRWLALCNPQLSRLIESRIGKEFLRDLTKIETLRPFAFEESFRQEFIRIRGENKRALSAYIAKKDGVVLPPEFVFDVHIKRLHEYKRQLLGALFAVYYYRELKLGKNRDLPPVAIIFGAKAAPAYRRAKAIIKFIGEIVKTVNADAQTNAKLRVVFVQNYNVSYAEKIIPAADFSEQISTAGTEASGTGNMKLMLNGAPTIGTLDGANVEICDEAGRENNYIFGATVEEVAKIKPDYEPKKVVENYPALKSAVETLIDGTFSDGETGMFEELYQSLLTEDRFLVLHDFAAYAQTKKRAFKEYGSAEYWTKCLMNVVSAGKFSSDRSVQEYAARIWGLDLPNL